MKTKIEKLEKRISLERGLVKTSLIELLNTGFTRTGKSGYSKGWASKSVWSNGVCAALSVESINYQYGNDAPRGGACGEFVKITDKVLLRQIAKRREDQRLATIELNKKIEETKLQNFINVNKRISELPQNEQFEAKWHSVELKHNSGMSWSEYREMLKDNHPAEWAILKQKFQLQQLPK